MQLKSETAFIKPIFISMVFFLLADGRRAIFVPLTPATQSNVFQHCANCESSYRSGIKFKRSLHWTDVKHHIKLRTGQTVF